MQQGQSDRPADILAIGVQPAFREDLLLAGRSVGVDGVKRTRAPAGTVRFHEPVLGRENSTPVFLRELLAGIEHQAEIGCMRDRVRLPVEPHLPAVRCPSYSTVRTAAAAIPGEAEVLPRLGDAVELAGGMSSPMPST
jgi:hypothetical protein